MLLIKLKQKKKQQERLRKKRMQERPQRQQQLRQPRIMKGKEMRMEMETGMEKMMILFLLLR